MQTFRLIAEYPTDRIYPLLQEINKYTLPGKKTIRLFDYTLILNKSFRTIIEKGITCYYCNRVATIVKILQDNKINTYCLKFYLDSSTENGNFYQNDSLINIDHIIPKSYGGTNINENLQIVCQRCNQKKSMALYNDPIKVYFTNHIKNAIFKNKIDENTRKWMDSWNPGKFVLVEEAKAFIDTINAEYKLNKRINLTDFKIHYLPNY